TESRVCPPSDFLPLPWPVRRAIIGIRCWPLKRHVYGSTNAEGRPGPPPFHVSPTADHPPCGRPLPSTGRTPGRLLPASPTPTARSAPGHPETLRPGVRPAVHE